jgi:hypothetical protein
MMVQICRAYQLRDQERLEMHEQTDQGQSKVRKDRRDLLINCHHESQFLHNHQLVLPQILHQKNQDSHHLNHNALRHVEISLTQIQRDDVREIFQQTMEGKIIVKPKKLPRLVTSPILGYFPVAFNEQMYHITFSLYDSQTFDRRRISFKYSAIFLSTKALAQFA